MDTVIADQNGRRDLSRPASQDELERKPRLAGTGRAADQDGLLADLDGRGVNAGTGFWRLLVHRISTHPFTSFGKP